MSSPAGASHSPATDPKGIEPAPTITYNPAILGNRQAVTAGYGARPRTVAHRALLVRAAVHPDRPARRPMVLVIGGALLGILGWLVMTLVMLEFIGSHYRLTQSGQVVQIALAVPAYLGGIALFSYGWQLGDRRKAIAFGILVAIAGIVVWLILALIAVLVVALAGSAGGGSGGSSGSASTGSSGSHGSSSPSTASTPGGHVGFLAGILRGGSDRLSWSHPDAPEQSSAAAERICPNCGKPVSAGATTCPACGHSMESVAQ